MHAPSGTLVAGLRSRGRSWATVLAALGLLAGCGAGDESGRTVTAPVGSAPLNLSGQVRPAAVAPQVSFHAASRFLEHAAFGPTPAAVADVQTRGFAGWIDRQLALPASKMRPPSSVVNYNEDPVAGGRALGYLQRTYQNFSISGEDQLRLRVSHALSNFVVVSLIGSQPYGVIEYFNLLQDHALGRYGDLLRAVSTNAAMGEYLGNAGNNRFGLNENYARELMQLFSVGLVQLELDGTVKRGPDGKPLETYTQRDVVDATRALTGWIFVPEAGLPSSNWPNYGKPMIPRPELHDDGAKRILGRTLHAGQSVQDDLDGLIRILVEHPNTAPFVSLRLIQNLTTSDPSPAYLRRVATVFRDSSGHIGQTVRAILLDPEARAGDVPGAAPPTWGRLREPYLAHVAVQRALGCQLALVQDWDPNQVQGPHNQMPLNAPSVFNFYQPNYRVPGSLLLAPEQRMLTSEEMNRRFAAYHGYFSHSSTRLSAAGCDVEPFLQALRVSEARLVDLLGERLMRGAMPSAVRQGLLKAFDTTPWVRNDPLQLLGAHIELIQGTPHFGVIN